MSLILVLYFLGTIPFVHTDHSSFELRCGVCNTTLNMPAAAIAHFKTHMMLPKQFCTSPPPLMEACLRQESPTLEAQLLPPLSPASSLTVPETSDAQPLRTPDAPTSRASDSPIECFLASLSQHALADSRSTIAPGQLPVFSSPLVVSQVDDLKQQLCHTTRHLVGLCFLADDVLMSQRSESPLQPAPWRFRLFLRQHPIPLQRPMR